MTINKETLGRNWYKIVKAVTDIGNSCTIFEIVNKIEGQKLDKNDWRIGVWRSYAQGSERRGYIIIDRSIRPYKYSLKENKNHDS